MFLKTKDIDGVPIAQNDHKIHQNILSALTFSLSLALLNKYVHNEMIGASAPEGSRFAVYFHHVIFATKRVHENDDCHISSAG